MLTLSKDQQLFKKAYNDYSDLDGDGLIESTYKHSIDYYGYFDPKKCYIYRNSRFEPERVTEDKYCGQTNEWAGNFLNWVSMSRMDAVRKLLYGGTRSTDGAFSGDETTVVTVLERAYIPSDAHAWAKYYDGADIPQLTPFAIGTGSSNVKLTTTTYPATLTQTFSIPTGNAERDIKFSTSQSSNISLGDQIRLKNASGSLVGSVMDIPTAAGLAAAYRSERLCRHPGGEHDVGCDESEPHGHFVLQRHSGSGQHTGTALSGDEKSSTNRQPPLIRVALGNYALWNASERVQCQWIEHSTNRQSGFDGVRSNGNRPPSPRSMRAQRIPTGQRPEVANTSRACRCASSALTVGPTCWKKTATSIEHERVQTDWTPSEIRRAQRHSFRADDRQLPEQRHRRCAAEEHRHITDEINLDDGTFKGNFYRPPGGVAPRARVPWRQASSVPSTSCASTATSIT